MNGVIEALPRIRELLAKAVHDADAHQCPDGYADDNGFADHEWLSDWDAFVADKIVLALEAANVDLRPLRCCGACELENSNLRKWLAWAGARLSIDDRRGLVEMIKHPVTKGGVLEDGREDDRRDLIECEKLLRRMVDHIQKAIDSKSMGII